MWYGCYPEEEHEGRAIMGDLPALAYEWIKAYALNLTDQVKQSVGDDDYYDNSPITAELLIETANSHQKDGNNNWGDYIIRGGTFEGESVDPLFWEKYAQFTGRDREDVQDNDFFSCSC